MTYDDSDDNGDVHADDDDEDMVEEFEVEDEAQLSDTELTVDSSSSS